MALLLTACRLLPPPPGDERLGEYSFVVEPTHALPDGGFGEVLADGGLACGVPELALGTFRFEGAVTRDSASGHAWLTLGAGYPRDAGWDGQVLDSVAVERRLYPSCAACGSVIASERLTFALLSPSQWTVVGGVCPADPLGAGLPRPPGRDGGVAAPQMTADGFDAALACGTFRVELSVPDGGDDCPEACRACVVNGTLAGERR